MSIKITKKKTLSKGKKAKYSVHRQSIKCSKYPIWKWWKKKKRSSEKIKWKSLEHNGPLFPPEYKLLPKHVKLDYGGTEMSLSKDAEEVAGFYGKMLGNKYTKRKKFNENFFKEWRKIMTQRERDIIVDFKKCNFENFYNYFKELKESKYSRNRNEIKKEKEVLSKYEFCLIDGNIQRVANFRMEPPGLFRGRGNHPKMGMIKKRILPENVTINIGRDAPIPQPPRDHRWREIVHINTVTWLARWNDTILNFTKYMMLHPSSKLKGEPEIVKYELARKLKRRLRSIRAKYMQDINSLYEYERQRAVVLYFIDKLALRAGYEKDLDTADTVGCCSLRRQHITLSSRYKGEQYVIHFNFLGKDSIRYQQSVSVDPLVYKNVQEFLKHKTSQSLIFDTLNPNLINKYLNELMENLTAKVFRTCHASCELENQLKRMTKRKMCMEEKLQIYKLANRSVAILCNHQRAVPKTFDKSIKNIEKRIKVKTLELKKLEKELDAFEKVYKEETGNTKFFERQLKKINFLEKQILKLQLQESNKLLTRDVVLGTSKLNYLDPRISIAWCKKWDVPIEKIYNKAQRERFLWAIETTDANFKF